MTQCKLNFNPHNHKHVPCQLCNVLKFVRPIEYCDLAQAMPFESVAAYAQRLGDLQFM
jgi:hypothetical protein